MKKNSFLIKVIVGLLGSTAFILLFNYLPAWATAIISTLVCTISYFELSVNAGLITLKPLKIIGFSVSAAIPWFIYFEVPVFWLFLLIFLSAVLAFIILIAEDINGKANELVYMIFCESIFQISISLMAPILKNNHGTALIIMAYISAWGTDALAQFAGKAYGKTHFLPHISPNKTLEGSLSGIIGNIIVITIYALILNHMYPPVPIMPIIACGAVAGVFGEIGDLFFSYFKRTVGIKDFGKFITGHGGVLDRFDSVLFVLPLWYALTLVIDF